MYLGVKPRDVWGPSCFARFPFTRITSVCAVIRDLTIS